MKKKKDVWMPVILGVGFIALVAGVVLLFCVWTPGTGETITSVNNPDVPATEAADDGVLKDYETDGYIKLADYKTFKTTEKKEDTDDWAGTVWDDYVSKCKVEKYPDGAVEEANADLHRQYNAFAEAAGMKYTELLDSYGTTEEDIYELAKDTVKSQMAAKTIAYREGLRIDESKVDEQLMFLMGYDESDKDDDEDLMKSYIDTVGSRPKDDIYVLLASEYIVDKQD